MPRILNTIKREDDLVDFLTTRPTVAPGSVLEEIRWEGGSNFDVMAPLFTMPGPVQDYVDTALTAADRQSLVPVNNKDQLRVTFKPSTFSLNGANTFWLRRVVRIDGIDATDTARYMMAPRRPTARPTYIISGTAPSLATVADSLHLELSSSMTSAHISVTSGSNLALAYDSRGSEQIIAATLPEKVISGTFSTLYIRGVGGGSVFDIVLSRDYA